MTTSTYLTRPSREVVVTGIGIISPIGIGREAYWGSLLAGRSGVRPFQHFDASGLNVRFGAEVLDFDPKALVRPRKSLKIMSRDIQFGFAAADQAFQDAGLTAAAIAPERLGVVYGADLIYTDLEEVVPTYRNCLADKRFDFSRWGEGMNQLYPLWLLKYLPNMPACHIAIALDARGPNNSIILGEASSLLAIAEGARVIERGQADAMIVGGASASRLHPTALAFRSDALLSRRGDDPASACRPFDADRDGMVNGEGAAAFVLESAQHAKARGAKIMARIAGSSSRFEPRANGCALRGTAIRQAIVSGLDSAGMKPADIGHVNAHGLATIEHDRSEAQAIREVLGNLPVTAPKSYFGNLGGAAGAVEMAASLIALEQRLVPPTLNYRRPDAECPVNVVHGSPLSCECLTALLLNQTTMGQSVALVLARD